MNLTRQTLLLWWGLTVTAAYLATEYIGHTMHHGHEAVLWTWSGAMLIPLGLTLLLGGRRNALAVVWAVATALVMAQNYWAHAAGAKATMQFSFHTLWFLFGAAGFAYTAAVVSGRRRWLYAGAAGLNLLGAGLLLLHPGTLKGYQYLVLALIQGVPMLLDVPLRRQHEAQARL